MDVETSWSKLRKIRDYNVATDCVNTVRDSCVGSFCACDARENSN